MSRNGFCFLLCLIGYAATAFGADKPAQLVLTSPQAHRVYQREDFEPEGSHEHHVYGPTMGYTDVEVEGTQPAGISGRMEFRVVTLNAAFGMGSNWLQVRDDQIEREGDTFRFPAEVIAGGWYRLDVRMIDDDKTVAEGSAEPFGVGEVFLVAGQSYAGGFNDELLKVTEPEGRVVAFDLEKKVWQVANDPQPHVGDDGTIWPALGDLLVPMLRVPVGFVNVSAGGTSSKQWLPEGALHRRLIEAGNAVGSFRAVLWQQGESDVIEKTPVDVYIKNLTRIRESASRAWQFDRKTEPHWLLAKSTLHPTVYDDRENEQKIRSAIGQLWKRPHFAPGPDTDLLGGENRGDKNSRRHFSAIGQRRAALLWFVAIWNEIEKPSR